MDPQRPTRSTLAVALAAAATGCARSPEALRAAAPAAPAGSESLTTEDWRADLRHLAAELPRVHRNAFHAVSREQWLDAVKRLDGSIPRLKRHQIIVGISKLVALIGDGHTAMPSFDDPPIAFRRYPVSFYAFSDGLYVRAAHPSHRAAVGGRVVSLGRATAEEAVRAAAAVDGRDNEMWSLLTAPWRLGTAEVVDALGLTDDMEATPLTVEKDGKRLTVALVPEVVPEAERNSPRLPAGWIDASGDPHMAWQRDPGNPYWVEWLPERRALYVQFNAVRDKPDQSLERFFASVFESAAAREAERLVLDMRNNGGGNNYLSPPIVKGIMRSPRLNARGRVYVIIGRHTFSAAQSTVNWLKKWTDAIFVGEPTGSAPNQFADAVPVRLPRSGLAPVAAAVWWQDLDERSADRWLAPDIAVAMSGEDYRRGVDPILESALTARPEPTLGDRIRAALAAEPGAVERVRRLGREYLADPRHRYPGFEIDLNNLGYELMAKSQLDAAVAILEINADAFPASSNAWDSLAEALMNRGETARAIEGYERSLRLDPKNANAAAMLAKLRGR